MKTTTRSFTQTASLKCLTLAGFYLSLAFSPAMAQSAAGQGEEEVYNLDDYVVVADSLFMDQVNALKTPTPIIDVPQSLSITTAEDISLRGFSGIGDIVDYTPGVTMSQGEGHRDAVVFRGVRSTADFFVDGVRDDVQYYRPLYNVEQVEILRGPNALFFGRGGAGGILNRVMKKGVVGEAFNGYSLSLDTFGGAVAQIDSNFALNEDSAFRVNAYFETFDNHRDFYEGEAYGVNPTARFRLSEQTVLDVSYEYLDHERFIDRGIPTANGEPVDALNDIVFGDPELNESTLEAHILRASLQHTFTDRLKANLSAAYGDYDKVYQNLYASAYNAATNVVTLDGYVDTTDRQNAVLSGNLVGEFETGDIAHTIIVGAEYLDTESQQDRYNTVWSTTGTDKEEFMANRPLSINGGVGVNAGGNATSVGFTNLNDNTTADLSVYSLYLQDEIELTESLQLVLGARFDSFEIDVTDHKPGGTNGSRKDEEVTPRAGIVFKPEENISLYASYSETFLPQSGEQYANLGDKGLDPDEFTNLEAGVKWDFAEALSLTAAIFQIDQDIVQDDGNGGSETLNNEINGLETQVRGYLSDRWFLTAGFSYLDAELDDGGTPREIPEHMVSIWNHYQVTNKLGLGLGATYQSESKMTNSDNSPELPGFIRFDAAAYYQINDGLRLQLNIENLLDEEYYPSAHSTHQATVGAPINARFAVVGRF